MRRAGGTGRIGLGGGRKEAASSDVEEGALPAPQDPLQYCGPTVHPRTLEGSDAGIQATPTPVRHAPGLTLFLQPATSQILLLSSPSGKFSCNHILKTRVSSPPAFILLRLLL